MLEANLASQIPGLRLLDRHLELEPKRGARGRVDFAGTDGEGHLVLVVMVEDESDAAALAALDLAVLARRHGPLLARHMGLDATAASAPRLILISEKYDDLLLARLSAFGDLFELFAIETLRSERGSRTYLVPPPTASRAHRTAPQAITREELLASLTERQRVPAELLITRLERMDSEVHAIYGIEGVRWTFQNQEFLGVSIDGDRLVGFVVPGGEDRVLESVDAVEELVELAFGAYIRLLGLLDQTGVEPEREFEMTPEPPVTLLSAEEIAAFQA